MNITEIIQLRKSVRNYNETPVPESILKQIQQAIDSAESPFGGDVTMRLKSFNPEGDFKPGTYGVVRGASEFLLLAAGESDASALSAGFKMEQVVLRATELGLGTCWIAGTFSSISFNKGERWPAAEKLRIISPIGYPANNETLLGKFSRLLAGSKKRKQINELFFTGSLDIGMADGDTFSKSLDMMRFAPSSLNSQPWRAITYSQDTVHFYIAKTGYLHLVDCGIGLCHFYLTEKFYGGAGHFETLPNPMAGKPGWTYVTSYIRTVKPSNEN